MPLTDMLCKNAKPGLKPCKLSDGNSLYLEISPKGSKYWRLKYRFAGKENRLSFGVYPEVSLKEARDKQDKARKLLAAGLDPSQAKKEAKVQQLVNREYCFENIAREWHENQRSAWTDGHAGYVIRSGHISYPW
jgi:hypothetical protein